MVDEKQTDQERERECLCFRVCVCGYISGPEFYGLFGTKIEEIFLTGLFGYVEKE